MYVCVVIGKGDALEGRMEGERQRGWITDRIDQKGKKCGVEVGRQTRIGEEWNENVGCSGVE